MAHFWANQVQERGRSGSMFFSGASIYSYGRHFEMARIARVKSEHVSGLNKTGVVLFNPKDYSVTTARHKRLVRLAIDGTAYYRFDVPCLNAGTTGVKKYDRQLHTENVDYLLGQADKLRQKALRAVDHGTFYRNRADDCFEEARHYREVFKLPKSIAAKIETKSIWTAEEEAILDRRAKAAEERQVTRSARYENRLAEMCEKAAEHLKAWRAGGPFVSGALHTLPVALRVAGEAVETSYGAAVALPVARAAWERYHAGQTVAGDSVGAFEVRSLDEKEVRIGCHVLPVAEIQALAAAQGWGQKKSTFCAHAACTVIQSPDSPYCMLHQPGKRVRS